MGTVKSKSNSLKWAIEELSKQREELDGKLKIARKREETGSLIDEVYAQKQALEKRINALEDGLKVSSELVDNIISKSKSLNILGGRLTGAGFGGCCVFLAERGSSKDILKFLNLHFENLSLVDII